MGVDVPVKSGQFPVSWKTTFMRPAMPASSHLFLSGKKEKD